MEDKKEFLLCIGDMQFFGGTDGGEGGESGSEGGEETLTLTNEELQKRIESEADRKLNSALEKKQKEWQAAQQKAIKDALAEEKRLAKLSEEEREKEQVSKREQDLANKEAELLRRELKADAIDVLTGKDLPKEFADFLLADDAESTLTNINHFKSAFDAAVQAEVKEKLRGTSPKKNHSTGALTKEDILNTEDPAKRIQLIRENGHLFNKK